MTDSLKRVLSITGAFPKLPCGVGDYTYQLMKTLTQYVPEIHILTLKHNAVISNPQAPLGMHIHSEIPAWSLQNMPVITKVCQQVAPDIVHIQYPSTFGKGNRTVAANLVGIGSKKSLPRKTPVITTLHEFTERSLRWRLRAIINILTSDHIICANRFDVDAVKIVSMGRKRVSYIPIASAIPVVAQSDAEKNQRRESLQISGSDITIAYFGFVTDQKGFDVLLQAMHLLRAKKVPAKLLILTKLDPQNSYHRAQIEQIGKLGIQESCLLGEKHYTEQEVSAFLQIADLAVFPFAEGTSDRRSSMLAALQHNLPTITTAGRSTPPNFIHAQNMLFVPPSRPDCLSESIMQLIADADLRQRLRRGAKELSVHYSWDAIAQRTLEVYHQSTS
ncbi:MAG: glycosyltransferase [Caldilineaceae bacterium]|nr:glycosyltransferase [Caldilineaceae bacterium]